MTVEFALRLLGAAAAMRDELGAVLPPFEQPDRDQAPAVASTGVAEDACAAALAAGAAMSLNEVLTYALGSAPAAIKPAAEPDPAALLTAREREVVSLLARGYTNQEISEVLVISLRTAEAHVTHVLNKLSLRSRAQVAVWAVEYGLGS